jgi:hypothetical protein
VGPSEGVVEVGASDGPFVELGTRRQRAQPYLTPAVAEVGASVERLAAELFKEAL